MMDSDHPSQGMGDTIAKLAQNRLVGKVIEIVIGSPASQCEGCDQRRRKLNAAIPYRQPNVARGAD